MSITFIDFFSGIGGFRRGMEMADHICVGHCEFDKYANMSYKKIHYVNESEWFSDDIRKVNVNELPKADCWCFGFPCQDISIAGKQIGFKGKRSSLFFTVTKLIRNTKKENKPMYLFIENVKNLLSINKGFDFLKLIIELDEIGYDVEWQVLNSKNFGLPQNRERVFIIGHLRGKSTRKIFPINRKSENVIKQIGLLNCKGTESIRRVYSIDGICPTLTTMQGGNTQPKILLSTNGKKKIRKLTPKECWRLQGWNDSDFEKAAQICSNGQLYKQAGNGVSVPVIYEIAKKL